LPKNDDVEALMIECTNTIASIDVFKHDDFARIRSAAATYLIIFCARRAKAIFQRTLKKILC